MRPPALCAGRGFWPFSGVDRNRAGFWVFCEQAPVQVAAVEVQERIVGRRRWRR